MLSSSTPDALWHAPAARLVRPAAIRCRDITSGRLLSRCSFRLAPGVRLLLVSDPPEAGSLLLRILAGLARPSAGQVVVAGIDGADAARHGGRVAYVGPSPGIHGWMTPREAVDLSASLLDLDPAGIERRIRAAFERVGIEPSDIDRPIQRGGQALAQRAAFAAAMVADPEVLLVDEPLSALASDVRLRLLRPSGSRRTLVVATRQPADLAPLATHVMLLRGGRVAHLSVIGALEAAGLPPTLDGIVALADTQARAHA